MVEAMVERLAQRLKNDGSDVAGWTQLVRSYRTLGKADKETAAIADARAALANDPQALQQLNASLGAGLGAADSSARQVAAATPMTAPASSPEGRPMAGPNAEQMAAASKMAPTERNAMIEGMVARLAQRMAENGSDVEGWLRLIRAYSVLGQRDKALDAARNARTALAGNSDNLRRIGELAKELGLEGS